MTEEIRRLVEVAKAADRFKQQQLAVMWPELAEAIAGVIQGMTGQDAPREWWPPPADDSQPGDGRFGLFQTLPPNFWRDHPYVPKAPAPGAGLKAIARCYFPEDTTR